MEKFLYIIMVFLLFSACKKENGTEKKSHATPSKRTIIVYMAADNNLWDAALEDIEEMQHGLFMFS
jgi:hypothetical protein